MTHWSKRVLGVICSFALAPFFGLCFFVHPAADDYVFAIMVRDLGFGAAQHDWYTNWTGRFVSTALISMASFDLRWYSIVPLSLLLGLAAALFLLVRAISAGQAALGDQLLVTFAALTIYVSLMPSPAQGLYWAAGAITYQAGTIFLFLAVALMVAHERGRIRAATCGPCAAVLIVAAAGCNETTMAAAVLVTGLASYSAVVFKAPERRVSIALLAAALGSAAIVVLAPGNSIRATHYPSAAGPLDPFLAAVHYAIKMSLAWGLQTSVLAALILLLPWAVTIPLPKRIQTAFERRPALFAGTLALLPLAMLVGLAFPSFLATGYQPLRRTENAILAVFLLAVFTVFTTMVSASLGAVPRQAIAPAHLMIAARVVLAIACLTPTVRTAWKDLLVKAGPYRAELLRRDEAIRRTAERENRGAGTRYKLGERILEIDARVVHTVPALTDPPMTIHIDELDTHPGHWKNRALASYWGLAAIAREPAPRRPEHGGSSH